MSPFFAIPASINIMSPDLDAMHANMLRAARRVGALTPTSAATRLGPWLLIDAGVGLTAFNQAFVAERYDSPARAVQQALDWFSSRGVHPTFVLRQPADDDIAIVLHAEGFEVIVSEPAMLLDPVALDASPFPGLELHEVTTPEEVARYSAVDAPAWPLIAEGIARTLGEFPDFTMLIGAIDGVDIATSMAVVTGHTVGAYNVYVAPEFRRRGIGRAITAAAVAIGQKQGCDAATLQSTLAAASLYEAMGFATQYHIVRYARPDSI